MSKVPEQETNSQAPRKYRNYQQLVRAVLFVNDKSLNITDCAALNCLAIVADWKTATSHPGNARLMQATRLTTRQGVNKVMGRLEDKRLIEMVSEGNGGRGIATVYRICVEDDRFLPPKPATEELHVSEVSDSREQVPDSEKPATDHPENPQLGSRKPATGTPKTRNSGVAHIKGLHNSYQSPSKAGTESEHPSPETGDTQCAASQTEAAPAGPQENVLLAFQGYNFVVTQRQDTILADAFPWVDRQAEYRKVQSWVESHPRKNRNIGRLLHGWFARIKETTHDPDSRLERNMRNAGLGRYHVVGGGAEQTLRNLGVIIDEDGKIKPS